MRVRDVVVVFLLLAPGIAPAGAWGEGGSNWGPIEPVSGQNPGQDLVLFADPLGNGFASWRENTVRVLAVRPPGGPVGPGTLSPQPGANWQTLQMRFDAQGNAVVAWNAGSSVRAAWRSAGADGQFGAVQTVTANASGFTLAVNDTGDALLVWVEAGSTSRVRAALRPAGATSTFGANQVLSTASGVSALSFARGVIDADRGATAVWLAAGGWMQSQQPPLPPGTSATQFAGEVQFSPPYAAQDFALNPAGAAILTFMTSDGGNPARLGLAASHRPPGGAFGAPQALWADAGADATRSRAALGANGHGMVAFEVIPASVPCGPDRFSVFASRMSPDGVFDAAARVSETETQDRRPDVAVDQDGHAWLVWESLSYDPMPPPCPIVAPPAVIVARQAPVSGGVGVLTDLSRVPGENAANPRIALGPDGHGFAAWEVQGRAQGAAYEPGPLPDEVFASGFE